MSVRQDRFTSFARPQHRVGEPAEIIVLYAHKGVCRYCEGIVKMPRDPITFQLLPHDCRCPQCGQAYYVEIPDGDVAGWELQQWQEKAVTELTPDGTTMTRRYWLSFVDDTRPEGDQFLGVSIVEVTSEMAAVSKAKLNLDFPQHREGAEWIAAATTLAHIYGCNPGGAVGAVDVTHHPEIALAPMNRLLQRHDLIGLGLIEGKPS
jgi:hypothetical protein